jgi:hypothetical protein
VNTTATTRLRAWQIGNQNYSLGTGQFSMLFPGVLHIFVECRQHLLGTSGAAAGTDVSKPIILSTYLLYSSGSIYYILSSLVAYIIHISSCLA